MPPKKSEETKAKAEAPKEVTFIWNRPIKQRTMVKSAAATRWTPDGPIKDPETKTERIKIKNGMFKTSDKALIEWFQKQDDFNAPGPDGYSIMKPPEQDKDYLKYLEEKGKLNPALAEEGTVEVE